MEMVVQKTNKRQVIKYWVNGKEAADVHQQANNVAMFPDLAGPVAIMPDAHVGKGVAIGTVFATVGTIIPNAVGADIGCGMILIPLGVSEAFIREHFETIKDLVRHNQILSVRRTSEYHGLRNLIKTSYKSDIFTEEVITNACLQSGTLGGGNHFIEFQVDDEGKTYLMVHSGSRNLGQVVNKHYDNIARELNRRMFSSVPESHNLAFLHLDTDEGRNYYEDMNLTIRIAETNRNKIVFDIITAINENIMPIDIGWSSAIQCTHNFARRENFFKKNVMVHRKGATYAGKGVLGLIPGSRGSASYIVEGKGNADSYNSCSHGAGRVHSRSAAKRELDLEFERMLLDDQNIIHDLDSVGKLDEATSAYKDIYSVMDRQADLVNIKTALKPIASIKN